MVGPLRGLFALLLLAIPFSLRGQQAPAAATPTPLPATATPIPSPMPTPDPCTSSPEAKFELTAATGTPVPVTHHFIFTSKNDREILVRLKDINPYSFKCSVSINSAPFKETAVTSFLSLIGGVTGNLGVSTPNAGTMPSATPTPSPTPTPKTGIRSLTQGSLGQPPKSCIDQYQPKHDQVLSLQAFRDAINRALEETRTNQDQKLLEFAQRVAALRSESSCSTIVSRANDIAGMTAFAIAQVPVPDATNPRASPSPTPMGQAIDELARRAQKLLPALTDGLTSDAGGDCKKQLQNTIDADTALIGALISSSTTTPSAVTTWNNQLKAFNTLRSSIGTAQGNIISVAGSKQNFTIDTSLHGHQSTVTYTATCTAIAPPNIPVPDVQASPTPSPSPAPSGSWSQDFKFGVGPFFVLAGGLVVSPLQQITFNTTATPGGSGANANTIIQQQNSSTRILPIAMLHGRVWDQLPVKKFKHYDWIPNYLSVGVTAKASDNKGTNIEYLFGPSWAFADRQFFLTAGAYAGQQQRLANSLSVGSTTSLSGANLPITQSTIWKAGFAITWAPGGK